MPSASASPSTRRTWGRVPGRETVTRRGSRTPAATWGSRGRYRKWSVGFSRVMSAFCRLSRARVRAVWYPAKPAPTIRMRGRLTFSPPAVSRVQSLRTFVRTPSWTLVRNFPRPPGQSPQTSRPAATLDHLVPVSPLPAGYPGQTPTRSFPEVLSHARIRLLPRVRGIRSGRARRAGEAGRTGGVPGAVDLGPLPPVERRAGPEPLRVVRDRRAVTGGLAAHRDGCDLP